MTLNGVMAVTLRYFTEFGKPVFQHATASICGGIQSCTSLLYFVVRVRCRRYESSRSLSHLLMSFLTSFSYNHSLFDAYCILCLLYPNYHVVLNRRRLFTKVN